ncbi:MAG: DUF4340 domain-containing protein [Anaerolinea sp.]|nr:DUF4340 domain-containing protein [Anaerolinea sp.]
MTQLQKILAGVLALQVVLAAVMFWPRATGETAVGPLFADLTVASITAVTIADNEGVQVELARQGTGWVLANGGDYPVDSAKIEPVLEKLAALQAGRLVARTPTSYARLRVADNEFVRRVDLQTAAGEAYTLYLGSSPTAQATHMRRADQTETYLVGGVNVWEVSQLATSWIDTAYISLPLETITAVTLQNSQGDFTLTRTPEATWTLADLGEGEIVSQNNLNALLGRITNLRLVWPLGVADQPAYGLANPQAMVTLTAVADNASRSYTLLVGAQNRDNGNYIVKWSDADHYVEVSAFAVEGLVGNGRDDFLEIPPTPAAIDDDTGG